MPETRKQTGTIKFFNARKGFGFITTGDGTEAFFRGNATQEDGKRARVKQGDQVSFTLQQDEKGHVALDVTVLDQETAKATVKETAKATVKTTAKATVKETAKATVKTTAKATVKETGQGSGQGKVPARAPAAGKTGPAREDDKTAVPAPPMPRRLNAPPVDPEPAGGFDRLGLRPEFLKAVAAAGYEIPTPIQVKAIPHVLAGKDMFGCAQTGTGKTAAFALPILQHLVEHPGGPARVRVLVLAPTRELAIQIGDSFTDYGKFTKVKNVVIFGGVGQVPQVEAVQRGAEVLVATPGRLLDLMGQGYISLKDIEILVLDEADRMLDMGFIHDVRRIMKTVPKKRQTLLFSATIPQEIVELAGSILHEAVEVRVSPDQPAVEIIEQHLYRVPKARKQDLLEHVLIKDKAMTRVLVFTRTKHGANKVVKLLNREGIQAEPIHGNKSQSARQNALANFRAGDTRVLVATDVAARGIDIDDITHVVQFDLPNVPETYVHRIGRTGRAGAGGIAISFCDEAEVPCLHDIEKLLKKRIPVVGDHPFTR